MPHMREEEAVHSIVRVAAVLCFTDRCHRPASPSCRRTRTCQPPRSPPTGLPRPALPQPEAIRAICRRAVHVCRVDHNPRRLGPSVGGQSMFAEWSCGRSHHCGRCPPPDLDRNLRTTHWSFSRRCCCKLLQPSLSSPPPSAVCPPPRRRAPRRGPGPASRIHAPLFLAWLRSTGAPPSHHPVIFVLIRGC